MPLCPACLCDPCHCPGTPASRVPAPDAAAIGAQVQREAEAPSEFATVARGTLEPHDHLPHWIATPPASAGLGDPEAVLAALRALDDADRARVLASLAESDRRRERDAIVARLRTLADHARNAAQSLCVPDYGFHGIVSQETAGIVRALRALAETTDRAAESASKAGV